MVQAMEKISANAPETGGTARKMPRRSWRTGPRAVEEGLGMTETAGRTGIPDRTVIPGMTRAS